MDTVTTEDDIHKSILSSTSNLSGSRCRCEGPARWHQCSPWSRVVVVVVVCQWNPWQGRHQNGQDAQRSSSRAVQRSPTLYPLSSIRNRSKELSPNTITNIVCQSLVVRGQVNKDMIQLVWAKSLHSFHHRSLLAYNPTHGRPCREFQESSFQ